MHMEVVAQDSKICNAGEEQVAKSQVVRTVEHAKYSSIPISLLWPKKRLFTFCGLKIPLFGDFP